MISGVRVIDGGRRGLRPANDLEGGLPVPPMAKLSRREFLRAGARGLLLAGLAVLGGTLAWRERCQPADQRCLNNGICGPCRERERCDLPAARSFQSRSPSGPARSS